MPVLHSNRDRKLTNPSPAPPPRHFLCFCLPPPPSLHCVHSPPSFEQAVLQTPWGWETDRCKRHSHWQPSQARTLCLIPKRHWWGGFGQYTWLQHTVTDDKANKDNHYSHFLVCGCSQNPWKGKNLLLSCHTKLKWTWTGVKKKKKSCAHTRAHLFTSG